MKLAWWAKLRLFTQAIANRYMLMPRGRMHFFVQKSAPHRSGENTMRSPVFVGGRFTPTLFGLMPTCCLVTIVIAFGVFGSGSAAKPLPSWVAVLPGLQEGAQAAEVPAAQSEAPPPAEAPPPEQKPAETPAQPTPPAQPPAGPPPATPSSAPARPAPTVQIPQTEIYEVRAELFKLEVTLSGKFHPEQAAEIILRPKNWTTFRVAQAVEHGARVKKGDVLLAFEADRFNDALADQRRRVELAAVSLKRAEEELRLLEATVPLDLAAARQARENAVEDWEYYTRVDRPFLEKSAQFSAQVAQWYLEYEQEELRQLEKMYQADELTDETEEIILRRQRNRVRSAEMTAEEAQKRLEEILKFTLPRATQSRERSFLRSEPLWRYSEATIPLALTSARVNLEEARASYERERRRLEELEADQHLMVIRSPMDGVVYYGRFTRGTWSPGTVSDQYMPGTSVDTNKVLMTVVQPRPLVAWVEVPENRVARIRPGLTGTAELPTLPGAYLPAKVVDVLPVPVREGNYAAKVEVEIPEEAHVVGPGASCQIRFLPYVKQRTLVVPASAVGTDELDPAKKYVWRLDPSGRLVRQAVTLGERTNDRVEILDGVVAGDKILRNYTAADRLRGQ